MPATWLDRAIGFVSPKAGIRRLRDLVQSAGRLRPDVRYRVVFTRSIGLPGRIVREGVEIVAPGAEIAPFRDFIARIEVDA